MQIKLGEKIRELRRRDGRTQESLADALGVSSQAVSRWEANGGYPDMETIPAIANFFHITIDELFGYNTDRDQKIKKVLTDADSMINAQSNIEAGFWHKTGAFFFVFSYILTAESVYFRAFSY